jgi:hypothetical protein
MRYALGGKDIYPIWDERWPKQMLDWAPSESKKQEVQDIA